MIKVKFTADEKRGASFAMAGCPCERCSATSVWREADGSAVCPSYRKCGRYGSWISEKWRAIRGLFGRGTGE